MQLYILQKDSVCPILNKQIINDRLLKTEDKLKTKTPKSSFILQNFLASCQNYSYLIFVTKFMLKI